MNDTRYILNDYYKEGAVANNSRLDKETRRSIFKKSLDLGSGDFWASQSKLPMQTRDVVEEFSLKGIEFGNWVTQMERREQLSFSYSAFVFMSLLFAQLSGSKKPFKNIGLYDNIGLAIGARGAGGRAAAHYEPGKNMINLTKTNGAGCLAHEYGHALDYNLGAYWDRIKDTVSLTGGHSTAKKNTYAAGGTTRQLANKIVDLICTTKSFERLSKASEYWHHRTEIFARWFEQYMGYCCKVYGDKFMNRNKETQKLLGSRVYRHLCHTYDYYCKKPQYLTDADFKKTIELGGELIREIVKTVA